MAPGITNSFNRLTSTLDTEESVNLKDRYYPNTKKKVKKRTKHPRDAGNIKQSNIHVISEKQVRRNI